MRTRPRPIVRSPLLLLLLLLWPVQATGQRRSTDDGDRVTTVILVRHAEKAAVPGADPPLSPEGEARALALRDALRDAGVTAVLVTHYRRTGDTALPFARARGVTPQTVPVGEDVKRHAREVAEAVERHAGETVLVVGHSNTLPPIIAALGGPRVPEIADDEYDNLYILQKPDDGPARLIRARFGAPSAAAVP